MSQWIKNVRLETGYEYEEGEIAGTKTELYDLLLSEGKIEQIKPASEKRSFDTNALDGKGMLILPAFEEKHIHLDKTYFGGEWKAPTIGNRFKRVREEQKLLPQLREVAQERAEKILTLLGENGAVKVRTHCNIEPVSELYNLEATKRALENYADKISGEIVAFPQHGLLRSNSVGLMKEAMRNGAHLVGGVDPATFDEDIEKSLHAMVDIAIQFDAGIDLHLHDRGHLGTYTMKRLAALGKEAGLEGKITISHGYALGDIPEEELAEMIHLFQEMKMDLTSAVPIDLPGPPIPLLYENGIQVSLGNDSITDHWFPIGTGDMLEKARRLAERFNWISERLLAKSLTFVTGGKLSLDDEGNQLWPKIGDEASFVLVNASCSAEAVARGVTNRMVFYKGKQAFGQ
ncbi:cytosine/adenosine deaminase-related metal-dependent hydrolase [Bacillus fengqiuensis]|nr:cytosine/adenosine deaminase-related metal-dependent hydrolase [Bacillus fengqiuensis]